MGWSNPKFASSVETFFKHLMPVQCNNPKLASINKVMFFFKFKNKLKFSLLKNLRQTLENAFG